MMHGNRSKRLTLKSLNPNVRNLTYPSRGYLTIRHKEIEEELEQGIEKPFENIINMAAFLGWDRPSITFARQILAAVIYPHLIEDYDFPLDVKTKARQFLKSCACNSISSYSHPQGGELIRKLAADFIERRDGVPADWENVYLTNGTTHAMTGILKLLRNDENGRQPGVMIPKPGHWLTGAIVTDSGMKRIDYYLDEERGWSVDTSELQDVYDKASQSCAPIAIVVVNPGNPTNQVLSTDNVRRIIKFAYENNLYVLADEVYQQNVYSDGKFHSFKKVSSEMEEPYTEIEMASFMSCSKGYFGEAGLRAGFVEVINMDPEIGEMYLRSLCVNPCPNTCGQAYLFGVLNEPKEGDPSYDLFLKEKKSVLETLKIKGKLMVDTLNTMEGVRCTPMESSVYAVASLTIPPNAIKAAQASDMEPDVFYALQALENAGLLLAPGSDIGQKPGTHHIRTSILLETEVLKAMLERLKKFHADFMKRYA